MTERIKTAVIVLLLAALAGSAAYAATTTGTTEVRIEARQLEDGRVEFALTQDGGGRILPRGRYFPADAEVGRWLRSTPIELSVEVESDEVGDDPANDPPASTSRYQPQQVAEGHNEDASLIWTTGDTVSGFRSFLGVQGTSSDGLFDKAFVYITCDHDDPDARVYMRVGLFWSVGDTVRWASSIDGDGVAGYRFGTTHDTSSVTGDSNEGLVSIGDSWVWLYGDDLIDVAKQKRWLSVFIPLGYEDWATATFDLSGVWGTPVQQNLDNCS